MNCPLCQAELRERTVAQVTIDECDSCGGFWFDCDELAEYGKKIRTNELQSDTPFLESANQKPSNCPRCRVLTLKKGEVARTTALQCRNCHGIFMTRVDVARLGRPDDAGDSGGLFDLCDSGDLLLEAVIDILIDVVW